MLYCKDCQQLHGGMGSFQSSGKDCDACLRLTTYGDVKLCIACAVLTSSCQTCSAPLTPEVPGKIARAARRLAREFDRETHEATAAYHAAVDPIIGEVEPLLAVMQARDERFLEAQSKFEPFAPTYYGAKSTLQAATRHPRLVYEANMERLAAFVAAEIQFHNKMEKLEG